MIIITKMKSTQKYFFPICILILLSSCSSIKNIKYFSDISDTTKLTQLANLRFVEPVILKDDILSINIQTVEPLATLNVTQGNLQNSAIGSSSAGSTGGQAVSGYLVDDKGTIELPVIGKVTVAGLTTEQARELIRAKAGNYYKNPTVSLRYANFKITVLGEVNRPAIYVVPNEKVNILDALGLAGDLTVFGKRENVVLIRQQMDGSRTLVRLDLTKSEILNSPYYFLRQNDYIYVETSKSKIASSDAIQNRNISVLTAAAGILVSIVAIVISSR